MNLPVTLLTAWPVLWASWSLAASDEDWIGQLQAQESLLTELKAAHGPLNPSLVRPLSNMIELVWEQSEFEKAAELQERMLAVMQANSGRYYQEWIPLLKNMVVDQMSSGETGGVRDLLQALRNLNAAKGDPVELINMVELQSHWLLAGGAGITHGDRIDHFFEARKLLLGDYVYLFRELFDENDPANIPRMYRVALNHYQVAELLRAGSGIGVRARHKMEMYPGSYAYSGGRGFLWIGLTWIRDIGNVLAASGDIEG